NILRKAAGQPQLDPSQLDPLLAQQSQQTIGPDGLPIGNPGIPTAPPPGAGGISQGQGFDVWNEPDDNSQAPLGAAPAYQSPGTAPPPNAPPGTTPLLPPNGAAPLSRADFFRPSGVPQSAGGTAPPIAGVLDKVPQVLNSNGSVADKALGA